VQCYTAYYVIKVLILWSWQRYFLHLCIHNVYSQYMYNTALYTHIYKHSYLCAPALEATAPTVLNDRLRACSNPGLPSYSFIFNTLNLLQNFIFKKTAKRCSSDCPSMDCHSYGSQTHCSARITQATKLLLNCVCQFCQASALKDMTCFLMPYTTAKQSPVRVSVCTVFALLLFWYILSHNSTTFQITNFGHKY
jgi:hypothetical protein